MKTKVIAVLLFAAVLGSAAFLLLRGGETSAPVARVTQDGVLLEEIPLDKVETPYSFTLGEEGEYNTVEVEQGRIRIAQADCPDQICVNQGWISDGTAPIVCLPHKLIIEIVDGGGDLDGRAG